MLLKASEIKATLKYYSLVWKKNGTVLKKMKETQSIFIHIPKTGGKSIIKSVYGMEVHEGVGHASVNFYLSVFGRKKFNKYFKFAFVRNPWDRVFSGYKFCINGGFDLDSDRELKGELGDLSFEDFVISWLNKENIIKWVIFRPQYMFICDKNKKIMIDRVCRFEDIKHEHLYLEKRFGIGNAVQHINESNDSKGYRDAYNDKMIDIVGDLYSDDIDVFGYEY